MYELPAPRPTPTPPICPKCGDPVPEDSIWQVRGRYCCSQECARDVAFKAFG